MLQLSFYFYVIIRYVYIIEYAINYRVILTFWKYYQFTDYKLFYKSIQVYQMYKFNFLHVRWFSRWREAEITCSYAIDFSETVNITIKDKLSYYFNQSWFKMSVLILWNHLQLRISHLSVLLWLLFIKISYEHWCRREMLSCSI